VWEDAEAVTGILGELGTAMVSVSESKDDSRFCLRLFFATGTFFFEINGGFLEVLLASREDAKTAGAREGRFDARGARFTSSASCSALSCLRSFELSLLLLEKKQQQGRQRVSRRIGFITRVEHDPIQPRG